MKKTAGRQTLQPEQLAEISGGIVLVIDPNAGRVGMMADPSGENTPSPSTGTVKIALVIDPGG